MSKSDLLTKEQLSLVGPTNQLYAGLVRMQEDYFDACEELKFNTLEQPLQLFFLTLGRITAFSADDIIASVEMDMELPSRNEMIEQFVATIHEGAKSMGAFASGHTVQ